jgi:antitoxin HicB
MKFNIKDYLFYPAIIQRDEDGTAWDVEIRGWDGAVTFGRSFEEAKVMAQAVIIDMAAGYVKDRKLIPPACKGEPGDELIRIPYDIALKFIIRNVITEGRFHLAGIAKMLNCSPQKVDHVLNFHRSTKLDSLAKILAAVHVPFSVTAG